MPIENVTIMQARLKVLHEKANVKQVKLLPVTLIGRSTECNLKIASSQVSRAHCRITLGEDTVYVEDLGSANGTMVDGQRLPAHMPTAVVPGATLIVGPAEFLIDYVASTSATMVLSRLSMPTGPELPSTEMLLPAADLTVQPGAPGSQAFNPPVEAPQPKPVANSVVPVATPVVQLQLADTAASEPQFATPELGPSPASSSNEETIFMGPPAEVIEPAEDEATQFLFSESSGNEESSPPFVEPKPEAAATKKGGLKSLFSLFGKKHKTEQPPPASVADSDLPSVYLPTIAPVEMGSPSPPDIEATEVTMAFGEQAPANWTEQTVTFDQPPTAVAEEPQEDEDDGFQQFLKQL